MDLLSFSGAIPKVQPTPLSFLGFVFVVVGTWLRLASYQALGPFYTYQLAIRMKHRLIKSGPYRFVRHPGYLALTLVEVGLWMLYGSSGSWIRESGILETRLGFVFLTGFGAFMTLSLVSIWGMIPREEAQLKKTFGEEWEKWAREEVRYRIIPGLY
jgi:protein-S-isoprenylcysteine O-methyltransferase Ste14